VSCSESTKTTRQFRFNPFPHRPHLRWNVVKVTNLADHWTWLIDFLHVLLHHPNKTCKSAVIPFLPNILHVIVPAQHSYHGTTDCSHHTLWRNVFQESYCSRWLCKFVEITLHTPMSKWKLNNKELKFTKNY
jgi:hypothetical protein